MLKGGNDDSCLSVDVSTLCTRPPESIQLSLPESFDDTLSIHGFTISAPEKCTSSEIRLLHAQLLELRDQVHLLSKEKNASLNALKNFKITSYFDKEYIEIRKIPPERRSLFHQASLLLYEKLSALRDELQVALEKAQNSEEIARQHEEKASNAQILCDQKTTNLQNSLNAAQERRTEIESKCKDLHTTVLNIQDKSRQFHDLNIQNDHLSQDVTRLRTILDKQQREIEEIRGENATLIANSKLFERTVQELQMDKVFLEQEKSILSKRTETSEEHGNKLKSLLREANAKVDTISVKLGEVHRVVKTDCDSAASVELQRIRDESKNEMHRYRSQVEASYSRELSLLKEAKNEATKECSIAKNETQQLKENLESLTHRKDECVKRLEKSLSDSRSDLKIKCIELSRLQILNENFDQTSQELQNKAHMFSDKVEVHKKQFKCLEQESLAQRKQFMEEIERKEEQLEMYFQAQHIDTGKQKSTPQHGSNTQSHFLEKAKLHEKENKDLQKAMNTLKIALKKQTEKVTLHQSQLESTRLTVCSLKEQMKTKEQEVAKENTSSIQLVAKNHSIREDLYQTQMERDRISKEFNFLQEKYHQLIERYAMNNANISPTRAHTKSCLHQQEKCPSTKSYISTSTTSSTSNVRFWTFDKENNIAIPRQESNTRSFR
jgi:chromosome segregation ATPase